jgi:hypothetical protein
MKGMASSENQSIDEAVTQILKPLGLKRDPSRLRISPYLLKIDTARREAELKADSGLILGLTLVEHLYETFIDADYYNFDSAIEALRHSEIDKKIVTSVIIYPELLHKQIVEAIRTGYPPDTFKSGP